MLHNTSQSHDSGTTFGGIQVTECRDLAEALRGEEGRFVATMPEGSTLIVDAQAGHSIASLRILPKSQSATNFTVARVGHFQSEADQGYRRPPRSAVAGD